MNMHDICMNHVQHPADTWTEDHRTRVISGACGQRLCLCDCTPQDESYDSLVIQNEKDPKKTPSFLGACWNTKTRWRKGTWGTQLVSLHSKVKPAFQLFVSQPKVSAMSLSYDSQQTESIFHTYMLSLLTASTDPGQDLPQPTKRGACTGAHLCKSRLLQIRTTGNKEENTTWGPAPKYSRHILT